MRLAFIILGPRKNLKGRLLFQQRLKKQEKKWIIKKGHLRD